FMPPCGEIQHRVTVDVVTELNLWRRQHPEFVVGGNEAGMLLEGDVRGADAAVWRATSPAQPGFARVPPVLAIEVVGADDELDACSPRPTGTSRVGSPWCGSSTRRLGACT